MVRRVARRAGTDELVGSHTRRHAPIAATLDAGVPLRDAEEVARRSRVTQTRRYSRARVSLERRAPHVVAAFLAAAAR